METLIIVIMLTMIFSNKAVREKMKKLGLVRLENENENFSMFVKMFGNLASPCPDADVLDPGDPSLCNVRYFILKLSGVQ